MKTDVFKNDNALEGQQSQIKQVKLQSQRLKGQKF